ncbi:hypothetical protein C8Q80DRAFT_1123272 [Daedaleopsis nitida]|nr:hypothetical protein C8Q80DRAFT_1123272 [Daedaleopsis nitida]
MQQAHLLPCPSVSLAVLITFIDVAHCPSKAQEVIANDSAPSLARPLALASLKLQQGVTSSPISLAMDPLQDVNSKECQRAKWSEHNPLPLPSRLNDFTTQKPIFADLDEWIDCHQQVLATIFSARMQHVMAAASEGGVAEETVKFAIYDMFLCSAAQYLAWATRNPDAMRDPVNRTVAEGLTEFYTEYVNEGFSIRATMDRPYGEVGKCIKRNRELEWVPVAEDDSLQVSLDSADDYLSLHIAETQQSQTYKRHQLPNNTQTSREGAVYCFSILSSYEKSIVCTTIATLGRYVPD